MKHRGKTLLIGVTALVCAGLLWTWVQIDEHRLFVDEFGFVPHIEERALAHDFVEYRLSRLCLLYELAHENENEYLGLPDIEGLTQEEVGSAMAQYDVARDIARSQRFRARERYLKAEELAFAAGFLAPKNLPCATPERQ